MKWRQSGDKVCRHGDDPHNGRLPVDELPEPWKSFARIGYRLARPIFPHEDQEDVARDIIAELATEWDWSIRNGYGPLPLKDMISIAHEVRRRHFIRARLGCPHRDEVRVLSLDQEMDDGDGHLVEHADIFPDTSVDLVAWADARMTLGRLPRHIVSIGVKVEGEEPLTPREGRLFQQWRFRSRCTHGKGTG